MIGDFSAYTFRTAHVNIFNRYDVKTKGTLWKPLKSPTIIAKTTKFALYFQVSLFRLDFTSQSGEKVNFIQRFSFGKCKQLTQVEKYQFHTDFLLPTHRMFGKEDAIFKLSKIDLIPLYRYDV